MHKATINFLIEVTEFYIDRTNRALKSVWVTDDMRHTYNNELQKSYLVLEELKNARALAKSGNEP